LHKQEDKIKDTKTNKILHIKKNYPKLSGYYIYRTALKDDNV